MVDHASEIAELKAKLKALEDKYEVMSATFSRHIKNNIKMDETTVKFIDLHRAYFDQVFDRILNIEVKLFPNLVRDLKQLDKFLGDKPDGPLNPLDHRKE